MRREVHQTPRMTIDTAPFDGSLENSEPEYLVIGRLGRPHGVKGEILMQVHTDFPERIKKNYRVYIGQKYQPYLVRSCRLSRKGLLIAFDALTDPEALNILTNEWVFVRVNDVPDLPEGEYYHHQMLGLRVEDDNGQLVGHVLQILETGGNDVLIVVTPKSDEVLIPVSPNIVRSIDLENSVIKIQLIEGLL